MILAFLLGTNMVSLTLDGSVLSSCRICGWATLPGSTLCVGCLDIREWSRVNRAFCELLHRTQPLGHASRPAEIYGPSNFALSG
jgi:hypothetical protein